MKKSIFSLVMVVLTAYAFSQPAVITSPSGAGSRETHSFTCMYDNVFSQVPVDWDAGAYCNMGYTYTKVADDYTTSTHFSTMRFWGLDYIDNMQPSEDFLIEFYDGVPGDPGTNVVGTFYVTIVPVVTASLWGGTIPIYEFTADFGGNIFQLSGWVSISRITIPYPVGEFLWLGNATFGNAKSYDEGSGTWIDTDLYGFGFATFFCLGGPEGYHDFECMVNPAYSQVPDYYDLGMYCDEGYRFTKVADDYSAARPFSTMRFWGVYDIKPTETFLIEFYDGIPGDGGTTIVETFNVSTTPVATPYNRQGSVIYQFDVDFGQNINQGDGWVSISRTTDPYVTAFAWLAKQDIGNALSYDSQDTQWELSGYDPHMFFCLGGGIFDLECMEDAVFSQCPDVYDNAYYCDADYAYSKVADNYVSADPIGSIRFWGVDDANDMQATETFYIEFYDGPPGDPGTTVVNGFNVSINPVQTPWQLYGFDDFDIYQFDVEFPWLVSQFTGWVSITRTTVSSGDFAWLVLQDGSDDFLQFYSPDPGIWETREGYTFFCLGPVPPSIPLSNWALYLGILLILAFTVLRLRKVI